MRVIHSLQQGSASWDAHRRAHFNASEAAAVLNISPYLSRAELLRQKATGLASETTETEQRLFAGGHANEATALPWGEEIVGESLYPITASLEVNGLPLSASYDGATMSETVLWEHKSGNRKLVESLSVGIIPDQYKPQMEQQLLILNADKCLFMASSGDKETMLHAWYESDPELRARLLAAWQQFAADLAAYVPEPVAVQAVAEPTETLPAVSVRLDGSLAVVSNLDLFGAKLRSFVDAIDKNPSTDQAFANCEAAVTTLKRAEDALEQAEAAALAQIDPVEAMRRAVSTYKELARSTRLMLDKLVKARKEAIKLEIVQAGSAAYVHHIAALNKRLGMQIMVSQTGTDFPGKIKGLRTVASIKDAVDGELARAKIEANAIADRIQINLQHLAENDVAYAFLFPDKAQIVLKAPDDFAALVSNRITAHDQAEAKRLEAERERIRAEEAARADREASAKQAAERAAVVQALGEGFVLGAPPAANVVPMRQDHIVDTGKMVALGKISERLGFTVTADFLHVLGFAAKQDKNAKLYRESQFPFICGAIIQHIQAVQAKQAA
jgi:putative phage-type endonuclease